MQLIIKPNGWQCTLEECEPGFFLSGKQLCFKSEYRRLDDVGSVEAFNSARRIRILSNSGKLWQYTDEWMDAISIVGRWSYSTTAPNDIAQACKRLAAFYYWRSVSCRRQRRYCYTSQGGLDGG